jgi:hypothetical protein
VFDVGFSLGDVFRLFRINVEADDLVADLGVADCQWEPDVSQAQDADDGGFVVQFID